MWLIKRLEKQYFPALLSLMENVQRIVTGSSNVGLKNYGITPCQPIPLLQCLHITHRPKLPNAASGNIEHLERERTEFVERLKNNRLGR